MEHEWQETRKREMLAEVVKEYSKMCLLMGKIFREYEESGKVSFDDLHHLVGEHENKGMWQINDKGKLWELKEKTHSLFRNNGDYHEKKFDKKIGLVYHELKKVKEEIYELENYLDENSGSEKRILREIKNGIEEAKNKFAESKEFMKSVLAKNRKNEMLLSMLMTEPVAENIYGDSGIINSLYPDMADAYLRLGKYYSESGWFGRAAEIYEKSLGIKDDEDVRKLLDASRKSLSLRKII